MQSCNTVYGIAGNDGKSCHVYLSVVNNSHLAYLFLVAGITSGNFLQEAAVDFLHNLVDTGK